MDGIHDLGGLDGFGPVDAPKSEPVFAEDWERCAMRATLATSVALGIPTPRFRHSIERMDPAHYLNSSYYEHWITGAATSLVEEGKTTPEDLDARAGGHFPLSRPDRGVADIVAPTPPRFAVGDAVRVRAWHPAGHTRAPRYVQGKRGVIVRYDGLHNYPDAEAHGGGPIPHTAYSVRFEAAELWGEAAEPNAHMHVDLYDRYLEPA
ncbi:MAG TPA: nitrile hydratase subunit beta [Acidimicrobiales bacterium]|nr:nitrile hydratase subunit beta [Acidimicrobiales bacterium]